MVRLTPLGPASVTIGPGKLTKPYKFRRGEWTPVVENDLDYLMSPGCPYRMQEEHEVGKWPIQYNGHRPLKDAHFGKPVNPGQKLSVSRGEAIRLLARSDVDYDLQGLVNARSVLITRYGGLGDIFLSLPAVSEFIRSTPKKYIVYATAAANVPVIEHSGLGIEAVSLEQVYSVGADFDAVVELSRWVESADDSAASHRADIFARRFGVALSDYRMPYWVREDERAGAEGLLAGVKRPLVIVQGSGSVGRRTPPKEQLQSAIQVLRAEGFACGVVDSKRDDAWEVDVNLTGCLTIPEMMAVLEQADVVVCGDSGVLHASNALGKKTVGLFGSVDAALRVKSQPNCRVISGVYYSGCGPCNDKAHCPHPEQCLSAVPVDVIVKAVLECLQ